MKYTGIAAVIVASVVVSGFTAVTALFILRPLKLEPEVMTLLNVLIGNLSSNFTVVVAYYMGSSSSSKHKDDMIQSALYATPPTTPTPQQ